MAVASGKSDLKRLLADARFVPLQMGTYAMTTSRSAPLAWLNAVPRDASDDSVE